jgi:hypothetical protein
MNRSRRRAISTAPGVGHAQTRPPPAELHPTLVAWLDRLELSPPPARAPRALERVVRFGGRLLYRRLLFITLFLIWFAFIAKTYTGEFFNYHPLVGFMNHPLVQFPCFDYVPFDLQFRG